MCLLFFKSFSEAEKGLKQGKKSGQKRTKVTNENGHLVKKVLIYESGKLISREQSTEAIYPDQLSKLFLIRQ